MLGNHGVDSGRKEDKPSTKIILFKIMHTLFFEKLLRKLRWKSPQELQMTSTSPSQAGAIYNNTVNIGSDHRMARNEIKIN